jgi:hypothetical protein
MRPLVRTALMVAALLSTTITKSNGDDLLNALSPQDQALINAVWADQTGRYDTCPRFKVIPSAVREELNDAGISDEDLKSDHGKYALLYVFDMIKHEDRSKLCKEAWEKFGPNGTYKRQMLEAK